MINIVEILKDCPKGTKLYSPTYGWGDFVEIVDGEYIKVKTITDEILVFNKYGCETTDGECLLYPSYDNRDWNTFNDPYSFKPFDKVVGRKNGFEWKADLFSHYIKGSVLPYRCISGIYCECLPYNEETAKLIGTHNCYER